MAGLQLYGKQGRPQPTIAEICALARVTTRNFYESFASREDLLLALYERLLAEQATRVRRALEERDLDAPFADQARPVIEAFIRPWAEDVRKARVAQMQIMGVSPDLDRRGMHALWGFARMIADGTGAQPFVAAALVGAVHHSLLMWHTLPEAERPPVDVVIDSLVYVAVRTLDTDDG